PQSKSSNAIRIPPKKRFAMVWTATCAVAPAISTSSRPSRLLPRLQRRRKEDRMATTTTKTETLVGKRIRRREDPRLITGTATYVDDIQMPGMHHACIVRSPHGAARIKSIDTQAALKLPGVVAVFTAKDTDNVGPVP